MCVCMQVLGAEPEHELLVDHQAADLAGFNGESLQERRSIHTVTTWNMLFVICNMFLCLTGRFPFPPDQFVNFHDDPEGDSVQTKSQ